MTYCPPTTTTTMKHCPPTTTKHLIKVRPKLMVLRGGCPKRMAKPPRCWLARRCPMTRTMKEGVLKGDRMEVEL
jgi:hypothetical protein